MQDDAPDGHPREPGEAEGDNPAAAWWPWPELQAGAAGAQPQQAPGSDETLGLPVEAASEPVREPVAEVPAEPDPTPPAAPEPAEPVDVPPLEEVADALVVPGPGAAPARSRATVLDLPNEAIPATPPEIGTGPVGSIPAARARAAWARVQASNWRLFLIRFLSAGVAVVLTVVIVPGLGFIGWRWGLFTQIAVIFGVLNATVKPLLQFLVLRFIFSTYGIVVVAINTLLLVLLAAILEDTFEAARPLSIVLGGLVVGVLGLILETLLGATPPTLDRDYKERNGLS